MENKNNKEEKKMKKISLKKKIPKKVSKSEVHAYVYIINELVRKKDWTKNQLYTQQECLKIKPIAESLVVAVESEYSPDPE